MKKLTINNSKKILSYLGVLFIGVLIGWLAIGTNDQTPQPEDHSEMDHASGTIWTCSMHPQIQKSEPGQCPICGMDLIPLQNDGEDDNAEQYSVKLSNAAMKIAEVEVSSIQKKAPYKEVYLPGKVAADERNIARITARFAGRIEKLMVNFTGQKVQEGQVLAKIYAPELVTAQRELFEAIKYKEANPNYYQAARNKLRLWDLTEAQIDHIEQSGEVNFYLDVLSPLRGTVVIRNIALGDYVKEGTALFEIVNLNHVWVLFDAYESDIPWIKIGDKINFTIKSLPDRAFESSITFIDPVLDPMSRVVKVRAELDNRNGQLKPEMLARGILKTMLPGGEQLVVPKSAILWTGKKAVVYVMTDDHDNRFQYREIELGADAGDYYVVASGLSEGEKVATHGVFKIDAAAQLKGEQSMMNPAGGKVSMGHNHGDMNGTTSQPSHQKHDTKDGSEIKMDVSESFKKQLTDVYESQLALQQAFISSDAAQVKSKASQVKSALDQVDMSLLSGEMHNHWMTALKKLNAAIDQMVKIDDIEMQRMAYADFSEALYDAIKMFGHTGETIYYQYCPMAFDNTGASWLSLSEEIRNPYFGDKMLKCGRVEEKL